jgi:DNA-binding CsgD family transcriptional regulator
MWFRRVRSSLPITTMPGNEVNMRSPRAPHRHQPLGKPSAKTQKKAREQAFLELPNPGENLFTPEEWRRFAALLKFTNREMNIAVLLVAGKTLNAIGRVLATSPHTARVHVNRLFAKAHVRTKLNFVLRLVLIQRTFEGPWAPADDGHKFSNSFR